MAKYCIATCVVALALFGFLVDAQGWGVKIPPTAIPQKPQNPVIPPNPPVQSCDIQNSARVACGASDITAASCAALSCCYDGQQCYYGKAVTVQCTKDGQMLVVVAKDATLPNLDLDSVSLNAQGQGCVPVDSNSFFAIYQFPVTACGTTVMEEPGFIIYENRMHSSYEVAVGPAGSITRDSHYDLLFQCRYTGSSITTLVIEVKPLSNPPMPVVLLGPLRVELRLASGQCSTKGCNEAVEAYSSYYADADYPVTKVLREPVYVEVRILGRTDPNIVLTLGRCWVTANPLAYSLPQWDLLINGCPYKDDRYLTTLVPVDSSSGLDFPTHYKRFIMKMFTFVDSTSFVPTKQQMFIHCSVAVCYPGSGSCNQPCFGRKRRHASAAAARLKQSPKMVVSSETLIMLAP